MRRTLVHMDELPVYLKARRSAIAPDDLGLPTYGQRRVPGLRREELAEVAGLSLTYYTRLEQGQATNPSPQVLEALSRALLLSPVERAHLYALAGTLPDDHSTLGSGYAARPGLVRLLDSMPDVPALLMARNQDILAWNRLGHALIAPHLDFHAPNDPATRPTKVALIFLDPQTRTLFREWEYEASLAVASLRFVSGRFTDDTVLMARIGELTTASDDFARLWAEHPVTLCVSGIKRMHHPVVGHLDLDFEVLHAPEDDGSRLLMHTARPGSRDADGLALLASRSVTG